MKTAVNTIAPGKVISYRGEPCIVLEHRREGALLLGAEWVKHTFGSSNNFAASDLRDHLNGVYLDTLPQGHTDEVIPRTVGKAAEQVMSDALFRLAGELSCNAIDAAGKNTSPKRRA